jgi:hypothetical protein
MGIKNKESVLGTEYVGSNTAAKWLDNAYYIFYNFIDFIKEYDLATVE